MAKYLMKILLFSCIHAHEMFKNEKKFKMKSHIWWIFYGIVSEQKGRQAGDDEMKWNLPRSWNYYYLCAFA